MKTAVFEDLFKTVETFSDLPAEAIVKQDVLRLGICFDKGVFEKAGSYKPKDYFIFSFDHVSLSEMSEDVKFKAPEEIRLHGGPLNLEKTVISVRISSTSPYCVNLYEEKPALFLNNEFLGFVDFHEIPPFYSKKLSSGHLISEIIPVLEWGYLLYLTAYRLCQYWGEKEECQFCDINENYRQQKKEKRQYTGIKNPELITEALSYAAAEPGETKAWTLTGGSVTGKLNGMDEVDFYIQYIEAIENKFPQQWISKAVLQAFPKSDCQRLVDAGLKIYHPNYEVWDPVLFKKICPGKDQYIGRSEWIKRVVDSVEVFGAGNVIPNFVGGVELSKPHGFTDVDRAISSTREGLEYFMARGVIPRFTTWCPEPLSSLGHQQAPPLEYFCKLLLNWREVFENSKLSVPEGYGPAGVGRAVFSVSAFMDVIRI
jgi:hypothetical protein